MSAGFLPLILCKYSIPGRTKQQTKVKHHGTKQLMRCLDVHFPSDYMYYKKILKCLKYLSVQQSWLSKKISDKMINKDLLVNRCFVYWEYKSRKKKLSHLV